MAGQFEGQVVWITGGGTGIGRSLAIEFARRGAQVAVSGRRVDRLQEVLDTITAAGGRAIAVACDVTDEESIKQAVAEVVGTFGGIDVAVANAGFGVSGQLENTTAEEWRRQLDTNVIGVALTLQHALPHLKARRGRAALVGSVAALFPTPGNGAYCASKYAVRAIGQVLAIELHGTGVSCTTIHPGYVASEIAQVDNQGRHHPHRKDRRPAQLMWTSEQAAKVCVDAIRARKREFVFTAHGRLGAFLGQHFPGLVHFVVTRTARKRPETPKVQAG